MVKKGFVPLIYDAIFKPFFSQDFYLKMFIEDVLKVKIKRLEYIDTLMAK